MDSQKKVEDYFREAGSEILKAQEETIKKQQVTIGELTKSIKSLETEIDALKEKNLRSVVNTMMNFWESKPKNYIPLHDIYIDDPIYGQISIPRELTTVFFQPILRRLSHIKQLSFAYMKFPTATHSRLSHSLGVARNAMHALQVIFSKGHLYNENGPMAIEISEPQKRELLVKTFLAALLHDIGHGPFGHALDRQIAYGDPLQLRPKPDKYFTTYYISKYLGDNYINAEIREDIMKILNPLPRVKRLLNEWDSLIADIIDSAVDTDRMDYLLRDAHMTGLTVGSVNVDALIERMIPFKENGQIRLLYKRSAIPYIEHFIYARDIMFISCYENCVKLSAEGMLLKAIKELTEQKTGKDKEMTFEELMLLTDDQLLHILSNFTPSTSNCHRLIHQLMSGDVFVSLDEFSASQDINRSPELDAWRAAKRKDNWTTALIEKPEQWEKQIAKRSGIQEWEILITVPSDETFPDKQIAARILHKKEDGKYEPRTLMKESPLLKELVELLAKKRQLIRLFVSPEVSPEKYNLVKGMAYRVILDKENPT